MSIRRFIRHIERLPSDRPRVDPRVWYKTQKDHWLGWLREYHGPGAYSRRPGQRRNARYAYNHIVNPQMLLWLISAAGVNAAAVRRARSASARASSLAGKSAAIRNRVAWSEVVAALEKRETLPDSLPTG